MSLSDSSESNQRGNQREGRIAGDTVNMCYHLLCHPEYPACAEYSHILCRQVPAPSLWKPFSFKRLFLLS